MSALSHDELSEVVEVVWMTVLELQVESESGAEPAGADLLISDINISGAWCGVVTVRASVEFLKSAAARMFSIHIDAVKHADCVDTLSELTNMLGGTVKCLLPEVSDLSLPQIRDSQQDCDFDWINFSCEGHPFSIAVEPHAENNKNAA